MLESFFGWWVWNAFNNSVSTVIEKKKPWFNLTFKKNAKCSVSLGIYHAFALCWCYHIYCPIIKKNVWGYRIHIASHRGFAWYVINLPWIFLQRKKVETHVLSKQPVNNKEGGKKKGGWYSYSNLTHSVLCNGLHFWPQQNEPVRIAMKFRMENFI